MNFFPRLTAQSWKIWKVGFSVRYWFFSWKKFSVWFLCEVFVLFQDKRKTGSMSAFLVPKKAPGVSVGEVLPFVGLCGLQGHFFLLLRSNFTWFSNVFFLLWLCSGRIDPERGSPFPGQSDWKNGRRIYGNQAWSTFFNSSIQVSPYLVQGNISFVFFDQIAMEAVSLERHVMAVTMLPLLKKLIGTFF